MALSIRDFKPDDFISLLLLSNDEWAATIQQVAASLKLKKSDVERCLIAEDEDEMVGFIYGFALPNGTLIPEFMYVKPSSRKSGVASSLLQKLEETSDCTVSMIFYNRTLHDYYEKRGYQAGENLETAMKTLEVSEVNQIEV